MAKIADQVVCFEDAQGATAVYLPVNKIAKIVRSVGSQTEYFTVDGTTAVEATDIGAELAEQAEADHAAVDRRVAVGVGAAQDRQAGKVHEVARAAEVSAEIAGRAQ